MKNKLVKKVSGIIIKDKKLLLVSSNGRPFFWPPGGHIDENESAEDALRRELEEELGITCTSMTPYCTYLSEKEEDNSQREVQNFLVEYDGEPHPCSEIDRIMWLSRDNFIVDDSSIQLGTKNHLIPRLFNDGLM